MKETNQTSRNSSEWAYLIRKYLALRNADFLRGAIAAAHGDGETEIVHFLESFGEGQMEESLRLFGVLSQKFQIQNRTEENLTADLLKMDISERLLRTFSGFPANRQREKWQTGESSCRQAIELSRRLNDRPCEAYYLLSLSNGLFIIGQYAAALPFFTQALEIYRELVKKERSAYAHKLADALNGLGAAQHYSSKFEKAIKSYKEALREYEKLIPDEPETYQSKQATTLNNLGIAQREINKLEEALESQKKALEKGWELARKNPSVFKANVAVILNSLGSTQSDARLFLQSRDSHEKALEIREKLGEKSPRQFAPLIAQSLNNLGLAYLGLEQYQLAAETCEKSLRKYQELAEHQSQYLSKVAQTSNNLGNIWGKLKNRQKAVEFYTKAVNNYREAAKSQPLTYESQVAIALNNLGTSHNIKQFPEALKAFDEALEIFQNLAEKQPFVYKPNVAITNNNIGNLYVNRGDWKEALKYYTKAQEIIENLYETLHDLNLKKSVFQRNNEVYKGLFTCYTNLQNWEKALEILEHGRSRSLTDLLNLTVVRPKFSLGRTPTDEELKNLYELGALFKQKSVKIQQADSALLALHQRRAIVAEIRKQFPQDSKIPLTINVIGKEIEDAQKEKTELIEERNKHLRKIQKFDKNFPPKAELLSARQIFEISERSNRVLVVFRVSGNGTFIFVVFPDGDLKVLKREKFTSGRLNEISQKWWQFNAERVSGEREAHFINPDLSTSQENISDNIARQIKTVLSELYRELMEPVYNLLQKKSFREVLLIPSNALSILPLHACYWENDDKTHYLLDEYAISYSTSISVFKHAWDNSYARKFEGNFLFVTNPTLDLAFSETEVDKIIATFGLLPEKYKDFRRSEAVKKDVKEMLEKKPFNIYHFSCHGKHNLENPFSSSLTLFDAEEITMKEIMEANLSEAWLTTLSACKTGLVNYGEMTDEHYGFPLGFIFAGCPSIWATLWSVDDQSTSELIQKAYSFLKEGKSKSEALRQAQIEYKREKEGTLYSSPFFWAGFQHYGV